MSTVPADHPVLVALQTKAAALAGRRESDAIALRDELRAVQAEGFAASPDTMHSHWSTLKTYLKLEHGRVITGKRIPALLDQLRDGDLPDVLAVFEDFMSVVYTRGNFILMPVIGPGTRSPRTNLNTKRGTGVDKDYWDRTLHRIATGGYADFFGGAAVAPRFRLDDRPGGFAEYIAEERLQASIGPEGDVLELWEGHLDSPSALPTNTGQVRDFVTNATAQIVLRNQAFA
ncbi:hypothetical protein [Microbacterium gorillae]|uniref:hypothetical protein n=1 Tax=Microbacterium gorillae TaxID=1231063 RepID=UPI00058E707C|nr:hypothetical protein [Microbacterium gorillae]